MSRTESALARRLCHAVLGFTALGMIAATVPSQAEAGLDHTTTAISTVAAMPLPMRPIQAEARAAVVMSRPMRRSWLTPIQARCSRPPIQTACGTRPL